jgi:hypothetical protein
MNDTCLRLFLGNGFCDYARNDGKGEIVSEMNPPYFFTLHAAIAAGGGATQSG